MDRHPKWVRVEPGTVIPAGQPYRIEYPESAGFEKTAKEFRGSSVASPVRTSYDVFVDSSWKPPLVLPTEPTWGIARYNGVSTVGEWVVNATETKLERVRGGMWLGVSRDIIADFIPLTDEQVARIEAAR